MAKCDCGRSGCLNQVRDFHGQARRLAATLKSEKLDELLRKGCPLTGQSCCEKKKTCEPDWGGHGEPAFCHLK